MRLWNEVWRVDIQVGQWLALGLLHGDDLGALTLDVVLEGDVSCRTREAGLFHSTHEVLVLRHFA